METYLLERGWPDDHQFETAFRTFSLYQRGYTRQVLETLERRRGHKEPADLAAAQVEHVMPQTLNESWGELLGGQAERIHAEPLDIPSTSTPYGCGSAGYAKGAIVNAKRQDWVYWTLFSLGAYRKRAAYPVRSSSLL